MNSLYHSDRACIWWKKTFDGKNISPSFLTKWFIRFRPLEIKCQKWLWINIVGRVSTGTIPITTFVFKKSERTICMLYWNYVSKHKIFLNIPATQQRISPKRTGVLALFLQPNERSTTTTWSFPGPSPQAPHSFYLELPSLIKDQDSSPNCDCKLPQGMLLKYVILWPFYVSLPAL